MSGLPLLHLDEEVAVVAKPSGLLVHPSGEAPDRDTCMSRLRDTLGRLVYPVHRLDRGTSGLVVFGLSPVAAGRLAAAFRDRQAHKEYLAVVRGTLPEEGTVDSPLRDERGQGIPALTRFRRLGAVELPHAVGPHPTTRYSLAAVEPVTGRTHQIRRHMVHLRHPVVGDVTYGDGRHNRFFRERFGVCRLLLHAWRLRVPHPDGRRQLALCASPPPEIAALFSALGWVLPPEPVLAQ